MNPTHVLAAVLPVLFLACSPEADVAFDPRVDFTGNYSVTVTNGKNGCGFADWMEGAANASIPIDIVQDAAELTATVQGISGALLGLLHGSNVFTGTVTRNHLTMWIDGTIPATEGNCTYTWSNDATATLQGDYLNGQLVYSRAHNGNPDCQKLACETIQGFNGTRPKQLP